MKHEVQWTIGNGNTTKLWVEHKGWGILGLCIRWKKSPLMQGHLGDSVNFRPMSTQNFSRLPLIMLSPFKLRLAFRHVVLQWN